MPKHYCAYLRKSRVDLEQERHGAGSTLDRHREILMALSMQMNKPIERFYEEVVSGESIADRPRVQELLSDIEDGSWDGVYCMDVDRLARGDTIDQGTIARTFSITGTKIITPNKTYDPDNEFDEEYFEYGLFTARREYKMINRRIQRGRVLSVKQGKYISPVPPYGYERYKLEAERGYSLRPHPAQADVVRLIYRLYTQGVENEGGVFERLGCDSIASYLDAAGIAPARTATWSRATVREILKNPVYMGKICWGRRKEEKTLKNGKITKSRPNSDEYIMAEGLHEALVDEHTFYQAQKLMAENTVVPVRHERLLQNPLAGLIYCKKCGQLMTRLGPNNHTKYPTLKCPNKYCDNIASPLYLVEEQLLVVLGQWADKYEMEMEHPQEDFQDPLSLYQVSLEELGGQLSTLRGQIDRTYTLLEQGIYTVGEFTRRRQTLEGDQAHLQSKMDLLINKIGKIEAALEAREMIVPRIRHLLEAYGGSASEKNIMLKDVLERVDYIKTEKNKRGTRDNANFSLTVSPRMSVQETR